MDNQLKIFIVDDDFLYLKILKKNLENLGFHDIISFTKGAECIKSLKNKPDIIFLDYNLGDLTGFNVLKEIMTINPNTYTIIISGQEDLKIKINSFKFGAFAYIQKGIKASDLIKIVTENILEMGVNRKVSKSKII